MFKCVIILMHEHRQHIRSRRDLWSCGNSAVTVDLDATMIRHFVSKLNHLVIKSTRRLTVLFLFFHPWMSPVTTP